jgi:hypothetical protein
VAPTEGHGAPKPVAYVTGIAAAALKRTERSKLLTSRPQLCALSLALQKTSVQRASHSWSYCFDDQAAWNRYL